MNADLDWFEFATIIQTYPRGPATIQPSRPNPLVRACKIDISVWDNQILWPMVQQLRYKLHKKVIL